MGWLNSADLVRLGCFASVLGIMALAETLWPRRLLRVRRGLRWWNNLALVALDALVVRFLIPLGAVGAALLAEENGWGLFRYLALPGWLGAVLAVVALDLVIYLQHVLFHAVPALWRLHMVHHADLDVDASTGLRFHPLEIVLSMGIKIGAVLLLGAPAVGVMFFEVLLNATSLFNHGNLNLPAWLDRCVRLVLVTPDMHRVHHSALPRETNSNFGFNLSWWDYLLGTYRGQPARGHDEMTIGLEQFRDERVERLHWMLALPFVGDTGDYPVNRSERPPPGERAPAQSASTERERVPIC
ncbi:MAG: sterol desaturase family protein [Gemmataceae bacterium]|nr:sterol desaturase family protein [Gemmataceae bacterium]MCI0741847.1 sterol desaturase family protein [Gemmataceae bacterium]